MKRFSVNYRITTHCDAVVRAKNAEEAKNKVIEVLDGGLEIESVYELKNTRPNKLYRSNPNA